MNLSISIIIIIIILIIKPHETLLAELPIKILSMRRTLLLLVSLLLTEPTDFSAVAADQAKTNPEIAKAVDYKPDTATNRIKELKVSDSDKNYVLPLLCTNGPQKQ